MSLRTLRYINYILAFLFIMFVIFGYNLIPLLAAALIIYPAAFAAYVISTKSYRNWKNLGKPHMDTPYKTLISSKEDKQPESQPIQHYPDDELIFSDDMESEEDYATVDYGDYEDEEFDDMIYPDEELEDPDDPDSIEAESASTGADGINLEDYSTGESRSFDRQYRLTKIDKVLQKIDKVPKMGGLEFEEFLRDLYDALGYEVQQTDINDQGADLIVKHQGEKIVIQAKRYKSKVSNSAVQQVFTAKHFYDCDRAIVITNSTFTKSAREVAEKVGVELWDHESLKTMLNSMKSILNSS